MKVHFVVTVAAVLMCGTTLAQEKTMQVNENVVGKLAVLQNGSVSFNDQVVTIEQLRPKLIELKKQNGVVWYYRETPEKGPPAISTQVIQAVIDNKLPISFSTKPDFSTVALPDGTIKPRR